VEVDAGGVVYRAASAARNCGGGESGCDNEYE
jgi:hypothetical protein